MMKRIFTSLLAAFLILSMNLSAQIHQHGEGHFNPDSLFEISISGAAVVDTNYSHPIYYLDENNDGTVDYKLNFGPFWYQPDSSNAVRPINGEVITIFGGEHQSSMDISVIVVYEINGEFWRSPFEPFWNNFTGRHDFGRDRRHDYKGFARGWRNDSLSTVTLTGAVLVDTTFYMNHYYLDINEDGLPDYFLNFGPFWYEPASGALRPLEGDVITVTGGLIDRDTNDVIIVYELNGLIWSDPSRFGRNLSGGWIHKNMRSSFQCVNPFDAGDNLILQPGWNSMGHMGGMMMEDSIYCQLLELYPGNMPNSGGEKVFSGYEIAMFNSERSNKFWLNDGRQRISFGSKLKYRLHYTDAQLKAYGVEENNITVKSWDEQSNQWVALNNVAYDYSTNTVEFEDSQASSYLILSVEKITEVDNNGENNLIKNFVLQQNYPNPFNPKSNINYQISNTSNVKLTVYDVLGKEISVLTNKIQSPGNYQVVFDGSKLSSGTYFCRLQTNQHVRTIKMTLIK
ncbi:MAG: hypothetical protein CVV23_04685 [Ignavibacteriae bacterium HGW-Ignavibacteriae-2]|jgi:hypothetical protein|nr:MAG: hypothetical protein CVV23_04685 [Ignavibacteriae bacterium HGW-Ignavibacteriae-2]